MPGVCKSPLAVPQTLSGRAYRHQQWAVIWLSRLRLKAKRPKWLLRIIGLFNPDAGELAEMVYEFEKPFIIDDSKFVGRFEWHATGLETVMRETVAWFKANG